MSSREKGFFDTSILKSKNMLVNRYGENIVFILSMIIEIRRWYYEELCKGNNVTEQAFAKYDQFILPLIEQLDDYKKKQLVEILTFLPELQDNLNKDGYELQKIFFEKAIHDASKTNEETKKSK